MTPRQQALAFRIWQYCQPLGWNVTTIELANALEQSRYTIHSILRAKGWSNRVRSLATYPAQFYIHGYYPFTAHIEEIVNVQQMRQN